MVKKIGYALVIVALITMNSCSGCVKNTSKKLTELSMDAVEGMIEAVDENGGKLAEKGTDAAGTVVGGIGKSISKQLEDNSKDIGTSVGKIGVRTLEGLVGGMKGELEELRQQYDTISCKIEAPKHISVSLVGRRKISDIIDALVLIPQAGDYSFEFESRNAVGEIILNHTATITKTEEDKREYTLLTFRLDDQSRRDFINIESSTITIKEIKK